MELKRKYFSLLLSIVIGQIIAIIIWFIFKEEYFIGLLFGSIVGFLVSYKKDNVA